MPSNLHDIYPIETGFSCEQRNVTDQSGGVVIKLFAG